MLHKEDCTSQNTWWDLVPQLHVGGGLGWRSLPLWTQLWTTWWGCREGLKNVVWGRLIRLFNLKGQLKQDVLVGSRFISLFQKEGSYLLCVQPVWTQAPLQHWCWTAEKLPIGKSSCTPIQARKYPERVTGYILGLGRTWRGSFCNRELFFQKDIFL